MPQPIASKVLSLTFFCDAGDRKEVEILQNQMFEVDRSLTRIENLLSNLENSKGRQQDYKVS